METSPIRIINAILMRPSKEAPVVTYALEQPLINVDGAKLVNVEGTKIVDLLYVDGDVEVFYRTPDAAKARRATLCQPTVAMLVSAGPEAFRAQFIESLASDETVIEVVDMEGSTWKLNAPPPEDTGTMIVTKMIHTGDTVEIIVTATPGSELAAKGLFLVFTLMPWNFVRVTTEAPLSVWEETRHEMAMAANEDDEEEEEEEEEDGLDEQIQTATQVAPPPPPPPPVVNGATTQSPTQE